MMSDLKLNIKYYERQKEKKLRGVCLVTRDWGPRQVSLSSLISNYRFID